MQLSGPRSRMGVRFGLLLALWRWIQSSRTCWGSDGFHLAALPPQEERHAWPYLQGVC